MTSGTLNALAAAVDPSGSGSVVSSGQAGTFALDFDKGGAAKKGPETKGYPNALVPVVVDGKLTRIGLAFDEMDNAPSFVIDGAERRKQPLVPTRTLSALEKYWLVPRRFSAVADPGVRWLAAGVVHELVVSAPCNSVDWDTSEIVCNYAGAATNPHGGSIQRSKLRLEEPSLRTWVEAGGNLVEHTIAVMGKGQNGPADALALAAGAGTTFLVYRATGAIFVLAVGWDGVPAEAGPILVAGGDIGAPSARVSGDRLWVAYTYRAKKELARQLHFVSFDPASSKVGVPKAVVRSDAIGSAVAPTFVVDGSRVAVAWLDTDEKSTRILFGRGSTPYEAANAATIVGTVGGEGRDLALAVGPSGPLVAWSVRGSKDSKTVSAFASRIRCP